MTTDICEYCGKEIEDYEEITKEDKNGNEVYFIVCQECFEEAIS